MSNFVPVSPVVGSRRWRLGYSTSHDNRPANRTRRDRSQYQYCPGLGAAGPSSLHGAPKVGANSARPISLAAKRRAFVRGTFVRPAAALRRQPDRRGQPWPALRA